MTSRRPADRKAQIRSAASDLFREQGYHNVSVADVADALGITPAALYHHYRNKQDLLLQAILDGLDTIDGLILPASTLDEALRSLATLVTGPRDALTIWEREARHLEGAQRQAIQAREAQIAEHLAPLVRHERSDLTPSDAELVTWAVLGVLGSRSRHRLSLPRRRHEQLMHGMAWVTVRCTLPPPEPSVVPAPSGSAAAVGLRRPRRDQLLTEAIRLFDERGFQSVTMADIGEAAGVVASAVYRHYPGKVDLLVAAMNRGVERVQARADQALAAATDQRNALDRLLRAHITTVIEDRHLVGILAHERNQLPDQQRAALRRHQSDYLALWVEVLAGVLPGRDPVDLKLVIHAVHSMIYLVLRSGRGDTWPHLPDRLQALGLAVLLHGLDV